MIKAWPNTLYRRNRSFQRFEKSYSAKRKKNPTLVYPRLRYARKKNKFCMEKQFFGKHLFAVQNSICGVCKNQKKIWEISKLIGKIFVSPSKKCKLSYMGIVRFIYGNCKMSIFFEQQKPRFFLSPDCFIRIKRPQKSVFIFFQHFLYDKHFRCIEVNPGLQ